MRALILGSFVFCTALVGLLTWLITRNRKHDTSDGYFLAGRALTGGYIAGSLMLTNLSTEQLVGLNGAAFTDGFCVMAWEVIAGMSLVIMALFFLPRYLRSGIATVPQFLEVRFDRTVRSITTLIFIGAYAVILLPIILYTGATGLAGILDLPELTGIKSESGILWLTVWMIGLLGAVYAIFGGLQTVAVSDTLNGMGLLVGGLLITWFGLQAVNDGGAFAAINELRTAHPEKFNSIGGNLQSVPFSTLFSGVLLLNLFYWCTNQQIIQRAFAAKDLAEGQKGVLFAGGLKVLAPLILVLPGIIAFHLYSGDNIKADHAYGILVRDVLPKPLVGFFAAVMVGAILSSFNSVLNSTATLFSLGVYQSMLRPQASEREVINAGKIFGWGIAIAAMCVAPMLAGQTSIFGYLQKMNGLYFIPIFAVVLVGMLSKRVPANAAKTALLLGVATIAIGYFVVQPMLESSGNSGDAVAAKPEDADNEATPSAGAATETSAEKSAEVAGEVAALETDSWFSQHKSLVEFHFLGAVFLGLIALMLLWGQIQPMATPWVHKDAGQVDLTPWSLAKPVGFGLVALVLIMYFLMADFSVLSS